MILGMDKLRALVAGDPPLVEGLSERELTNPEGAGYDLSAGELWALSDAKGAFIGVTERETFKYEPAKPDKDGFWSLYPQGFWVVETRESVDMPPYLVGRMSSRTTMFTCGLFMAFGPVQPGYKGTLRFGLRNVSSETVTLERGARICHIQFELIEGVAEQYRGQWAGGRVFTKKREVQV
jgi:deoxycytidine triphosphate deaminase